MPSKVSTVAAATLDGSIVVEIATQLAPAMPTIPSEKRPHREKLSDRVIPFNLMVARPVGKQEMTDNPLARAAVQKEWAALRDQKVWNLMIVREKSDVVNEARINGTTIQLGRVHPLCMEKEL